MKNSIILFLFLVPVFLLAQYPTGGNKSRLGYQTTGDGLIWRGVAADTAVKPRTTANAYFQLDTVNGVLRRYIATLGKWQTVGGSGTSIDSLVYSTIKGLNDSIQAEKQTLTFANPLLGISDGNNVDLSPLLSGYITGSGTNNRIPKWSAATNLTDSDIQDNGTAVSILSSKPFQLGQWTTAGRPSGVNGYLGWNTTFNWFDAYSVSGWFSPLQSSLTGGIGVATRVVYIDGNGRATTASIPAISASTLKWYGNNVSYPTTDGGVLEFVNYFGTSFGIFADNSNFFRISYKGAATTAIKINTANQVELNTVDIAQAGATYVPSLAMSRVEGEQTGIYRPAVNKMAFVTARRDRLKISNTGVSIAPQSIGSDGTVADAARSLDVFGDLRIRDLITDNPTKLIGADSDGDINEAKLGSGLSFSGDTLKLLGNGKSIYNQLPLGSVNLTPTGQRTLSFKRTQLSVSTDVYDSTGVGKIIIQPDTTIALNIFSIRNAETGQSLLQFGGGRSIGFRGLSYTGRKQFWDIERVNLINSTILPLYGEQGAAQSFSIGASKIDFIGDLANTALSRIRFQTGNNGTSTYSQPLTLYENGTAVISWGNPAYYGRVLGVGNTLPANFPIQALMVGDTCTECSTLSKVTFVHDPNDSTFIKGNIRFFSYGTSSTTAAALSKTLTNYGVGFATDGTVTSREIKRDTTIYVDDADYDFSAAITTAQIASRFNRVIFWMTTTAAAGSDSELTLHTPDANLMQVEYLIHSVDEPAGFDNKIVFGTNNAVDSTNGLVTNYYPAAGDGIHIRAGLRSGVYKYRYSN